MTPRGRSELYRLAVGLAALGLFLGTAGRLGVHRPNWVLVFAIAIAGVLAMQFPLLVSVSMKVSVATAVFFACVLLMPPLEAAALVAGVSLTHQVISLTSRVVARGELPPFVAVALSVLFNPGHAYLSVLAAGIVLTVGGVTPGVGLTPAGAAAVVGAAAAMYGVNMLLVSTAEGLLTSRNPLTVMRHKQRILLRQFASLYLIAVIVAFAGEAHPWIVSLSLVAAMLVYLTLRHRIALSREAVRAMERMADEVDRRDPYTYQHSQRVAAYSTSIARRLGLSSPEIQLIELAAKVHDIGKIRLPDAILLKPGKLTTEERRVMETHPRLGFDILRPFSEYAKVLDLVLTHHERYDGFGYPNQTVGRRLHLIAQVIPVADSLDAMTSNRAYRGARSWESAMDELRRGAGTQWNPKVVDAALLALGTAPAEGALQPALA